MHKSSRERETKKKNIKSSFLSERIDVLHILYMALGQCHPQKRKTGGRKNRDRANKISNYTPYPQRGRPKNVYIKEGIFLFTTYPLFFLLLVILTIFAFGGRG